MHNVYERQSTAKSRSTKLVFGIYGLVVLCSLITGFFVSVGTFGFWFYCLRSGPFQSAQSLIYLPLDKVMTPTGHIVDRIDSEKDWDDLKRLATAWWVIGTLATGAGMVLISVTKRQSLKRDGGAKIAKILGGTEIIHDNIGSLSPELRQALHVLEEMSIAAQVPPPRLFILQSEDCVNGFVAGNEIDDAVLGLTHGTIANLKRGELQALVAHEFAHMVNGDMKLNLEMIGLLQGLYVLSTAANRCLKYGTAMVFAGQNGADDNVFAGVVFGIPTILAGLVIWPIGFAGSCLGALAHGLLSCEREFLADAFAVQFTRNQNDVLGALKQMAWHGSLIQSPAAAPCGHLFFGAATRPKLGMPSHPPLGARILELDQNWDGQIHAPEADNSSSLETLAPAEKSTHESREPVLS